jgi:hypothetical protein
MQTKKLTMQKWEQVAKMNRRLQLNITPRRDRWKPSGKPLPVLEPWAAKEKLTRRGTNPSAAKSICSWARHTDTRPAKSRTEAQIQGGAQHNTTHGTKTKMSLEDQDRICSNTGKN